MMDLSILRNFVAIADGNKGNLSFLKLQEDYELEGTQINLSTFRHIALNCGFKALFLGTDWKGLIRLCWAFPALATTRDGRSLIVSGYRMAGEGTHEEAVVLQDLDDMLYPYKAMTHDEFEEIWDGGLIVLKKYREGMALKH